MLKQSDGNPYYLEEFVRMLAEKGYLGECSEERWAEITDSVDTPTSVQVLIRSRVDALPEASRQLLHAAAVLGASIEGSLLQLVARRQRPSHGWPS